MSVNRFVNFSPREFVQTYEPLPIDNMIQLGQIGQRRNDAIDSAIGKAAGDMTFEGGLATQGLASTVTKEYNDQLNALSDSWGNDRNSSAVIQGLSKLKQQMASDPRMVTLNSDKALKPFVLANMNKPEYGKSLLYKSYDDETGQFNIGDMNSIIGRNITPADYGLLSTEGSAKAFDTIISPVKADLLQTYEYVADPNNPDGPKILKNKETRNDLDMNTFIEKAFPFVKNFSSDGISIDQTGSADPVTKSHIEWRTEEFARQGKVFQMSDLLNDLELEAKKHLQFSNKKDATGSLGKDGSGSDESSTGIFSGSSFSGSIVDAGITNKEISEATNPMNKTAEATGLDLYGNVQNKYNEYNFANVTKGVTGTIDQPLSKEQREESLVFHEKQVQMTFDALKKEATVNHNVYTLPNGQKVNINTVDDKKIMQDANNIIYNQRLAAGTLNQTLIEASRRGVTIPPIDNNGKLIFSKEDKEKVIDDIIKIQQGIENASNTNAVGKSVGLGGGIQYDKGKKVRQITKDDITDDMVTDYYSNPLHRTEYSEFFNNFNNNLKTNFGKREFSVQEFSLFDTQSSDFTGKEIPTYQKEITARASDLAFRHSDRVSYNGRKLNCIDCEDGEDGMTLKKLYMAGTGDDTGDFSGGKFTAKSYFYDHARDRIFARGQYESKDKDGNNIKSKQYDINIDEIARHYMSGDQQYSLLINDAVQTSLNTIPKGTAGFVQSGDSEDVVKKFGKIAVTQDMDGNWSLESGKVFIDGNIVEMRDVLLDPESFGIKGASRIDPDNMTYNQIVETVIGAYASRDPLKESKNVSGPPLSSNWENEFSSQPSFSNLATSIGVSTPDNLLKFTKGIMDIESAGGKVNKMGGSSNNYAGVFQLGDSAIKSAASELGVSTPSKYDLVNDTSAQANMFYGFTKSNLNTLTKGIPGFTSLPEKERLAILAYAHQRGASGTVADFKDLKRDNRGNLIKGNFKDSFGTPSSKYFDEIIKTID
jgi:hypothetical protein